MLKKQNKTKPKNYFSFFHEISQGEEETSFCSRFIGGNGDDDDDDDVHAISIAIMEDRIGRLLALIYAAHVASTRS